MTRYTIEQQGGKWVASNGTEHVEADDPEDAFFKLLGGELDDEHGMHSVEEGVAMRTAEDLEDAADRFLLRLIRLLAMRAPAVMLRHELAMATKYVEQFIGAADLE
jgi:hypothetical protein